MPNAIFPARAFFGVLILCLFACAPDPADKPTEAKDETRALPPGFMDEAPAPPTSNTLVLSGGTLLVQPPIEDSVIVITDGNLIAFGPRGGVEMPNDSIGKDMRGKWIVGGLDQHNAAKSLRQNDTARLLILDSDPREAPETPQVVGRIDGSEVDID